MKKIMFNDKYGLTQAVLEGRKTQTRRVVKCPNTFNGVFVSGFRVCTNANGYRYTYLVDEEEREIEGSCLKPTYEVGEIVAVAQSYHNAKKEVGGLKALLEGHPLPSANGIKNKMFVRAELMPHHIKFTNSRVERLQDISDEDCLADGIFECVLDNENGMGTHAFSFDDEVHYFTPRNAYAALIDKVSGKGTWESNPYVFVYEFELVD